MPLGAADGISWNVIILDLLYHIYCEIINNVQLSKWEYFTASVGFNLPADVALYKKFTCDADGKPDCEFQDCELADTSR